MKRSSVRPKRATPRRRIAPRWDADGWATGNLLLMVRCGGRCERCGKPLGATVERHHRQRRTVGGDRLANLLALHPECHAWVTTHPAEAEALGLIVSAYAEDPALVPVETGTRGWVTLADDGTTSAAEISPNPLRT